MKPCLNTKKTVEILEEYLKKKEVVIITIVAIETIHYLFRRLERNEAKDKAMMFIQGEFKILDVKENY